MKDDCCSCSVADGKDMITPKKRDADEMKQASSLGRTLRLKSALLQISSTASAVMAERLRRQTRNLLGFPRVGSNPTDRDSHSASSFF